MLFRSRPESWQAKQGFAVRENGSGVTGWATRRGCARLSLTSEMSANVRLLFEEDDGIVVVELRKVTTRRVWSAEVTTACLERFERRLVEEVAGLRVEMAKGHATLGTEIAQAEGTLRADLVREMQVGFATLRQEMANNRVEFLRWSFLFWVGQFFAVAGLVGALMRTALAR